MATNTPNFNFILPGVGDPADQNLWGNELNDNLISQDNLLNGFAPKASPTFTGIVTINGMLNEKVSADVASASTINLDTATGNIISITGTTAITAVTLAQGGRRTVRFDGVLTLTNSANLVLPTGANIITQAGDYVEFVGNNGVVEVAGYQRADGSALGLTTSVQIYAGGFSFINSTPVVIFTPAYSNVGSWYSTSTGRITAVLPVGITAYLKVSFQCRVNSGSVGSVCQWYKNGTGYAEQFTMGLYGGQGITSIIPIVNGDYVDLRVNSGTPSFTEGTLTAWIS